MADPYRSWFLSPYPPPWLRVYDQTESNRHVSARRSWIDLVDHIAVLVCEDHTIYREGVKSILARESDLKVVGEACDTKEAIHLAQLLKPDVMLLNLSLPGIHALETTRHVAGNDRNVRILVLGMYDDEETALRCRDAGASGYLLKDAPVPQLLLAIRHVRNSMLYLTPASLKELNHSQGRPNAS